MIIVLKGCQMAVWKVITGLRRVGKSYLLFNIFKKHLLDCGVKESQIVEIALDQVRFERLLNPLELAKYIRERVTGKGRFYVLIDEIQLSLKVKKPGIKLVDVAPEDRKNAYITFYDVLNEFRAMPNVDVYVTGSNSKMLSKDVATNFRDRGVEVRVWPLGFDEYLPVSGMEKAEAWDRYLTWGGMPLCVLATDDRGRRAYLNTLFQRIYLKDIVERYSLADDGTMLSTVVDILASDVGSLTNPQKLAGSVQADCGVKISGPTVAKYIGHLVDSFLYRGPSVGMSRERDISPIRQSTIRSISGFAMRG